MKTWTVRCSNTIDDLELHRDMLFSARTMNLPIMVQAIEREVKRLENKVSASIKRNCSPKDTTKTISEADKETALNYPIENLLEVVGKNKCHCPFHSDANPSASIKNNKFKCFVCNDPQMDTIALYRKLHDCDFTTAVKALI